MRLLCRISLEPDFCVRRSQDMFARYGGWSLLVAKFVPGLNTVAQPLAGVLRMRRSRFLLVDILGAFLWIGTYTGLGYFFSPQVERIAASGRYLGAWLFGLVFGGLALYLAGKYIRRQRFIRTLRIARITPAELKRKIDTGPAPVIVDLRHSLDFEANTVVIPGAVHMSPEELERHSQEIPRDRDVILYCTCPNEATSARVALLLRRRGIQCIRPLAGGLEAWREAGFPVEAVPAEPAYSKI